MKKWLRLFHNWVNQGLLHIFGSSIIAQVAGIISSVVVIRNLPKLEYGFYVDANNIYSYLAVFIGLGFTSAILQYCSERISEHKKMAIYRYSALFGAIGNIAIAFIIVFISIMKSCSGDGIVADYLLMMAGIPFVSYTFSYMSIVLRVRKNNRMFAYANIAYSVTILVGNIILTLLIGIPGLIITQYIANVVGTLVCSYKLQRDGFLSSVFHSTMLLEKTEKKEITNYALICAITNFASTALVLIDVTCLGIVLGDSTVLADYKVASTIPTACAFIPTCLTTFFYPRLVESISISKHEGRRMVNQLGKIYLGINGTVYVGLAIAAKVIIWVIFGSKYMNILPIFEVLCFNFLIQSIKKLLGNTIAAVKRVRVNLIISIISGVLNIVLNLTFIPRFGSIGAAAATTLVGLITLSMEWAYLQKYWKEKNE